MTTFRNSTSAQVPIDYMKGTQKVVTVTFCVGPGSITVAETNYNGSVHLASCGVFLWCVKNRGFGLLYLMQNGSVIIVKPRCWELLWTFFQIHSK